VGPGGRYDDVGSGRARHRVCLRTAADCATVCRSERAATTRWWCSAARAAIDGICLGAPTVSHSVTKGHRGIRLPHNRAWRLLCALQTDPVPTRPLAWPSRSLSRRFTISPLRHRRSLGWSSLAPSGLAVLSFDTSFGLDAARPILRIWACRHRTRRSSRRCASSSSGTAQTARA
jgi:hypothetical protein